MLRPDISQSDCDLNVLVTAVYLQNFQKPKTFVIIVG